MCFGEPVHAIAGASGIEYTSGRGEQKSVVLVVGSNVVVGHMGYIDNLDGGV